jgi:hypothetical protein
MLNQKQEMAELPKNNSNPLRPDGKDLESEIPNSVQSSKVFKDFQTRIDNNVFLKIKQKN